MSWREKEKPRLASQGANGGASIIPPTPSPLTLRRLPLGKHPGFEHVKSQPGVLQVPPAPRPKQTRSQARRLQGYRRTYWITSPGPDLGSRGWHPRPATREDHREEGGVMVWLEKNMPGLAGHQ
jgi:hypothetical protein